MTRGASGAGWCEARAHLDCRFPDPAWPRMTAAVLENFLQALTAGLLSGSLYGMMCVGLALIFGIMRVINFAQGEFLMLGMYFTLYIVTGLRLPLVLGPYASPYVAARSGGAGAVRRRLSAAPLSRVPRDRDCGRSARRARATSLS